MGEQIIASVSFIVRTMGNSKDGFQILNQKTAETTILQLNIYE